MSPLTWIYGIGDCSIQHFCISNIRCRNVGWCNLQYRISSSRIKLYVAIVDKDHNPVRGIQAVLIPDRQRDRRDLLRLATSDQNGQFVMRTVIPGEYKLFAWEDIEPFAYNDPDFLRKYEALGMPIKVSESSKLPVELKLIPASQ